MKKICMLLVLLSGVAFAAGNQGDTGCKVQELGECQFLYTCENSVSMIVTKQTSLITTVTPGKIPTVECEDKIINREIVDMKNMKIVNSSEKK